MGFQAGTQFAVDPADPVNTAFLTDLFVTPDGGFQVVWQTQDFSTSTVTEHYRIYDAAGVPVTGVIDAGSWQGDLAPSHVHGTLTLADGTTLKEVFVNPTNPSFPPTENDLQQFAQNGVALGSPILKTGLGIDAMVQLPDGDVVFLEQPVSKTSIFGINGWVLHNTSPASADTTAPTAVDFFPATGSNTLAPDWNLGITFSEAVKAGSGTITLETASGQVVQTFAAASDPGIQFIRSSLVINPAADLQPGTTYKLVVDSSAVQDLAGNAYAGLNGYTFTTAGAAPPPSGDTTAPTAVDVFPGPGSNTLPPDWNLGLTFNEAVKAGAGTITLETAAGQVVQTFAAASDPGIQFIGSSLVINPAADLQPGTTYQLVVDPSAVQDLAGNAYAGLNGYTFTTAGAAPTPSGDTTPPIALDFFPAPGSHALPPDWNLAITFSEAVKAGAGTITLETAAGQVVQTFAAASDPGIQFIGSSVVINPAADLQPGTAYQLVVAPDAVTDLAGNAYAGESDFTFTAALVGVPAA